MMPEIHWTQIAFRLALTLLAGTLLGLERSKTGHFAGLCPPLLGMLPASVSLIPTNLLIQTNGKPQDSYAVMDVMRLPLGILTGVGFIGAGAIVRKGDSVTGVATAAPLWFMTLVGLTLGAGELVLGGSVTVAGLFMLSGLERADRAIRRRF